MLNASVLKQVKWDEKGLVAAIAQEEKTGEILMLAWLNEEALRETLATGRVCYFSRSRQKLWRKGEESGQIQKLKSLRIDCDGDAVLLLVEQTGVACHTGHRSCFYREVQKGELVEIAAVEVSESELYGKK